MALLIVIAGILAGCQTTSPEKTDEIENLQSLLTSERKALTACEAELEKNGLYVVRPGDTLARIAKVNGIEIKDLVALNPILHGTHRISIGMILKIKINSPNKTLGPCVAPAPQVQR